MPIDPVKMLADVPGALHVMVEDAAGAAHDAVLTVVSEARGAQEYGFPQLEQDTLYVAAPFDAPRARISYTRGTTRVVRRVTGVADNAAFFAVTLGEVLHGN